MSKITKKEKKLFKQMKKMLKAADAFDRKITKADAKIRRLPIELSLRYNLEKNYFKDMPTLLSQLAKLQMISGALVDMKELLKGNKAEIEKD